MIISAGIHFISGHQINELKFVAPSGKGCDQNIGFGDISLPDFVTRRDLNPKFSASVFIEDPSKYRWGIKAGKIAPFDASVLGD